MKTCKHEFVFWETISNEKQCRCAKCYTRAEDFLLSRTCESCEHFTKETFDPETSEPYGPSCEHVMIENQDENFGCNKWEGKE